MGAPGWVGLPPGMSAEGQGSAAGRGSAVGRGSVRAAACDDPQDRRRVLSGARTEPYRAVKRRETNKAVAAIANYDMPEFHNCVGDWEREEYFEFL